jgi:hypothetical protein
LGIASPGGSTIASLDVAQQKVEVSVVHDGPATYPVCGRTSAQYDTRQRRRPHLDFSQYQLFIAAEVPRVECDFPGVE